MFSSRKRWLEFTLAAACVVAAILGRASAPDPTALALVGAAVGGAVAWLIYRTLIRDRLWIVPPTLLCLALIGQLMSLSYAAYPGARVDTVVAIVGTLVGYRVWRWLVTSDVLLVSR
jgi:hypothetical protein